MSRIDQMIRELCPNGVHFATIGEVADVTAGATPSKSVAEYWTNGTIPWLSSGEVNKGTIYEADTLISQAGYDSCSTKLIPPGAVVMALAGQGKTRGTVARTRLACCTNQSLASIVPNEGLDADFLFYFLGTQYSRLRDLSSGDGTRGGLNLAMIRAYRVPVPPLEVQREIVRVLDQFTQLEAELEAELEARRRQYEHYLHSAVLPGGEVEWTTLGEATSNHDRKRKPVTRSDRQEGEFPYYGANGVQDYVHDFIFDGTFLLVGEDGSVKKADGTPVLNWASGKIWVNNHAHVLTASSERFNLRYLYYYLATVDVSAYVTGGTQPKINQKNLNAIPVPVVSRDFQDGVVEMLDRFDALVNDISIGLPAELAARRKQYEYYRDKLLTFEEAAA